MPISTFEQDIKQVLELNNDGLWPTENLKIVFRCHSLLFPPIRVRCVVLVLWSPCLTQAAGIHSPVSRGWNIENNPLTTERVPHVRHLTPAPDWSAQPHAGLWLAGQAGVPDCLTRESHVQGEPLHPDPHQTPFTWGTYTWQYFWIHIELLWW